MSKDNHSFSVSVAIEVGIPGALLLQHLLFLQKSLAKSGNAWQKAWVKRSAKALTETYPYWSGKQISAALVTLEGRGLIASKIDNEQKGDRSKSFILTTSGLKLMGQPFAEMENGHFPKEQMPFAEMENDICRNGKSIKVDYTDYTEKVVVEKETTTTENGTSPVEAEKEKKEKLAAPAPATGPAVDIETELERLRADERARENFSMTRKIPAVKFEAYVDAFKLEVSSTQETYWKVADFRRHFFNWSGTRYEIECKNQSKPGASPAPGRPRDMVQL